MEGLLGFLKTPAGQGLLAGAASYAAGARRGAPINSVGRGLLGGLVGYNTAATREEEAAERAKMGQFRDAQIAAYTAEAAQKQAAAQREAAKRAALPGLMRAPGMTGGEAMPQTLGGLPMFSLPMGTAPMQATPGGFDVQGAVAAGFTPEEITAYAGLGNIGRPKVARTVEVDDGNGGKATLQVDEYGQPVGQKLPGYVAPVQVDTGRGVQFVRPQAGVSLAKQPTFADGIAAGNLGVSRTRLAMDQGNFVADAGGPSQAGLVKQFGKAAPGYRWKSDGSQEFIPGGPADQKAQLQKSGEGTVGSVVADLRDRYAVLNEGGGVVSTERGVLGNVAARVGASGVGQTLGGAVGTKNQSARDSIAMTRPLLLQAIMKATGMSAKQMDSNAELKLYLATATDPTLGYEANMQALDRIEALYGGGAAPKSGGATGSWEPTGKKSTMSSGGWSATLKK